ncbi:acetate kinase [candidate division NPL-UPA2 bacterium]|nr:acetate kinase [candidate division NPL-UPA2 bacterium]
MKVLVVNCGSSSIKYQLFEMPQDEVLSQGLLGKIGEESSLLTHQGKGRTVESEVSVTNHEAGMRLIMEALVDEKTGVITDVSQIEAVGHRVVHGGEWFSKSVRITEDVLKIIERYADLAPLHNPPNLAGIKAVENLLPGIVQVAAFDTAFHQTIPEEAYMYALPYDLYEKFKLRRYGFHGTSHRFVARRAAEIMGKKKEEINIITCHLGNGCSITAVRGGKSVDTSMGLTPLEGLVMGTRSGDIDPAVIFYLAENHGMSIERINTLLNRQSGLLGISGISNDVRNIAQKAARGERRAKLALDVFCYRVKKYIGAYTAVLGRLNALVFTGGIGENASYIREKILENLDCLGIKIDLDKNADKSNKERVISSNDAGVTVFVIPTNEEVRIAYDTYEVATSLERR